MFTFRTSITLAVMTFVVALAGLLIAIQARSLRAATHEAASAFMDSASTKSLGRLQGELNAIASLVNVLATSSSVADSNERSETGRAIPLFKAALQEMPQMDSIYAGFDNGAWLQVRRTSSLSEDQRDRLRAPASAEFAISLIRPTPAGDLPMRRVFQDRQGNEVGEIDLWNYGYDGRKRSWYWQTLRSDRPYVSAPYLSFSIDAPVITVSAPLRGKVPGVLAADLKLDTFSAFVQAQRPGQNGTVMIFDQAGSLIAHPEFTGLVESAMTHPSQSQLPSIDEINSGMVASVVRRSHNRDHNEGLIRDEDGQGYLFRLTKFTLGEGYNGSILLLAAEDDFVQNVRRLQFTGLILAIIVGAAFVPLVWMFGSTMSHSLKRITAQAGQLQTLAEPSLAPVTSYIREIHELGSTVNLAQRAIWSFAHFVPKEIVRGLIDNSISTTLGVSNRRSRWSSPMFRALRRLRKQPIPMG
ncbi:hypothetical protein LUI11_31770 [Bradyrhizobium diazoefficiens]|uniref:PDC sensor domain-containing protein n=1 Tax=Bradyrhizobium TaxID=374 RepID=UPI0003FA5F48|nr:cache domain-containing protein [Bradyrhizobium diazoefficiens]APO51658.1 hypothetical protein BD122_15360 [Bradyrhizobium diazoefficiens]KOY07104.1 hypothetical protein AF336_28965 [Bradyrhizobium diazoefficiens]MCD9297255.1 hypothetical protein [Bradyrhizobium diazoefficiens]MCD9812318.1 hypothetical protein [Bradyrhizobium diazoefficiens]MCD9830890.1 hypothetical protein [Bradyrhizobium diazoefficiens]